MWPVSALPPRAVVTRDIFSMLHEWWGQEVSEVGWAGQPGWGLSSDPRLDPPTVVMPRLISLREPIQGINQSDSSITLAGRS